jgi:cation diffusion facilitator CzcD-associated flavoprotein CzcO
MMHSARWDWSYDLRDKRVAIIGNGASAAQILPAIVDTVKSVTVFQRTANWIVPRLDTQVPPWKQALLKYVPPVRWRIRAMMMDFREGLYGGVTKEESEFGVQIKKWNQDLIEASFPGDEEMKKKLTPNYAPGCKRVLLLDDYYIALAKPNVKLETRPIERITKEGIKVRAADTVSNSDVRKAESSQDACFDLLVLATGFHTNDFLNSITITGAQGRSLSSIWDAGAHAYLGVTVPSLPNFGLFYGPNTNLGHNSIVLMIEAQSRYLSAMISSVLEAGKVGKKLALKPRDEAVRAYNQEIQAVLNKTSFADPRCNSWYKDENGRIVNNWSGTVVEYQERLSKWNVEDYEIEGDGKDVLRGMKEVNLGRVKEETSVSNLTLLLGTLVAVAAVGGVVASGRIQLPRQWRRR